MGIKLKIALAFSAVFILLSGVLNLAGYQQIRSMLIEDSHRYVVHIRDAAGGSPVEPLLAAGDQQLQSNLRLLLRMLIVSCVLSILLSGLVSFVLARILMLPLQRIIHAARNINANKMRNPIPVHDTRDELHELSVTINAMMHRIEESLQQQQNFFGSASHELKTPLAILRTELEVGLRKPGLEDGVRQLLSNQLDEISRLQQIVGEFLVVSQLRVGAPAIYRRPFDLSVLVVKVYNQLLPLLRQKNFEPIIRFDEEAADFILSADEDKIRIVLLNLLENAAKYGVENTSITCTVERGAAGELTVQFTNVTSAEKVNTENLQVAFYRSDLIQKGAGLGLWLCNEIIRLHEGLIHIASGNHRFQVAISLPVREPMGEKPVS